MKHYINIINSAIENGFEFDTNDTMEEIREQAENFLIENTEAIEEECEVSGYGNKQSVNYYSNDGTSYESSGEIVHFSENWHQSPDTKVFHTTLVNNSGQVVKLYYLVGETDYNAPEGFYFDKKTKTHKPFEA